MKIEVACSLLERLKGLLGRSDYPDVLLLFPCNDVHTFGMRRAIDIAFVSACGVVLETYRNVGACKRVRCKLAHATLERISTEAHWFEPGDQIDLKQIVEEARNSKKRR